MAVLVTGGAGYIGSHTVKYLLEKGEDVIVCDDLSTGHREALENLDHELLYVGNLRDSEFLKKLFDENNIEAVIHFAASSLVGESMTDPLKYYKNNVYSTTCLLEAMIEHNVDKIVFSSSAAVYGEPENIPITETEAKNPTSTYGETKLVIENMISRFGEAYGINHVSLRYFNACGAHMEGTIGEDHKPESHLIPIILQVALGQREKISIFGDDYETEDGTCIRDYVHVWDLAQAHYLALNYMRTGTSCERGYISESFNLGSGRGYSVYEILSAARKVTGCTIPAESAGRREGDPTSLIADSSKAVEILKWKPQYDNIETIIAHAWQWHRNHPFGF